ncbi:MAG: hypothetical protein AB7P46_03540 [Thermoanaerobaculia bacterium]
MSANFEAFMRKLRASRELASFGFEELAAREKPEKHFEDLLQEGFFSAGENPVPVEDEANRGYYRIPFWPVLRYLLAVARRSSSKPDLELGAQVLEVVREVSLGSGSQQRDNYHTNRIFAEILGAVPVSLIREETVDLLPIWLAGRFEGALVSEAVSKGLLSNLLGSEEPRCKVLALRVFGHLTALSVREPASDDLDQGRAVPAVEAYWLRKLLLDHAKTFGREMGADATALLSDRIRQVFGTSLGQQLSCSIRPSIGDHDQNHSWEAVANGFVEALRDSTLEWIDSGQAGAREFVEGLLRSDSQILRRIGLYVLKERWAGLASAFHPNTAHFAVDLFHETYELVAQRWAEFSEEQKELTRSAIEEVARANPDDEREFLFRTAKWLRALEGKGLAWVEEVLAKANAAGALPSSEHPDFQIYHETRWGPGPSPLSRGALKAMAIEGTLISQINAMRGDETWNGSPVDALIQEFEEAIVESPEEFLRAPAIYLEARPEYFYAFLMAVSRLWSKNSVAEIAIDTAELWKQLINGVRKFLLTDESWATREVLSWKGEPEAVSSAAMKALAAGARDELRGIPASLLEVAIEITTALLDRLKPADTLDDDPMHQAINSTRGKVIESLIGLTLRSCREADLAKAGHSTAWSRVRPIFDRELDRCTDGNFEFSTLLGSRLSNFYYLDDEWVRSRALGVFSLEGRLTRESALDGLAYAATSRAVYRALRDGGVILDGLRHPPRGRQARERLVESVGLGYLWGEEELDGENLTFLVGSGREEDLVVVAHLYWALERQGLEATQVAKILSFVRRTLELRDEGAGSLAELKRALGRLICFVERLDDEAMDWLRRVIPEVAKGVDFYEVAEEFVRLADLNPHEVLVLLSLALDASEPDFDLDGHLLETVRRLSSAGFRSESFRLLERMRRIEGAEELYRTLRSQS